MDSPNVVFRFISISPRRSTLFRLPILLTILLLPLFSGCYLVRQGFHLIDQQTRSRPVARVLRNSTDSSLNSFLLLSQEIRNYALDSLGLARNRNYTTYVETKRDYSHHVLSAVRDDRFDAKLWCFPIVGCVPYKGFFNEKEISRHAQRLRDQNYDIYQWRSGGFSTLGILTDPLLSSMRDLSVFGLASLIIHEQTHATIFLKSQTQFNEELATFIGNEGALRFIASRFGDTSTEYRSALEQINAQDAFRSWIANLYASLDSLYQRGLPRDEVLSHKLQIIESRRKQYLHDNEQRLSPNHLRFIRTVEINNAYLSMKRTYAGNLELFYQVYDRNGRDLRRTISLLKGVRKSRLPPVQFIQRELLGISSDP